MPSFHNLSVPACVKRTVALAAMGVAMAGAAQAENPSGAYVGGGFGQFNLEIENLSDAGQSIESIAKSDDNSWKVFAGWRFNPYLALEAAYVNLGDPRDRFTATGSDGNYRVKMDGFTPSVIGSFPLGPVELFGKVGYYFYDVDLRTQLDSPGSQFITSKHSRSDIVYGGGVGITVLEHVTLRAEYERFKFDNYGNSDALWLTAAWRF